MSIDFTSIDFETANYAAESPCAVGLVKVRGGKVVDSFATAFMPPSPFDDFYPMNIKIHGIRREDVENGPTWAEVLPMVLDFIGEDTLIAHNAPFDMGVLRASADHIGHPLPQLTYACTVLMSRKAFPGMDSHRLNAMAYRIGWEDFNHHDALEDARVCAEIVLYIAKRESAQDLDEVLQLTGQKLKPLLRPTAK